MKIESIIKRDPPTEVLLGDTAYKFKPDSKGRHVCEVTDKAHIARLLSIAEGFQIPDDEDAPKNSAPAAPVEPPAPTAQPTIQPTQDPDILLGADGYPAVIELGGGKTVDIADVIAEAHELSYLTTADWNALDAETRSGLIDAVLDGLADSEEEPAKDASADEAKETPAADAEAKPPVDDKAMYEAEREALAVEYKAKFGAKPHYKWTMDKIREELAKPVDEAK